MEVLVAALADYAAITSDDKLIVAGIFDVISGNKTPLTLPIAHIALRLQLEYEDKDKTHKLEILVQNQDGKPFAKIEADLEVGNIPAGSRVAVNSVFTLQQLTFDRADKFSILVLWDGDVRRRIPLDVAIQPQPPQS